MVRLKAEFGVRSSGFGEAFTVHRSPFGGALRRCGPESHGARHQLDANSNPFPPSRPLRLCGEICFFPRSPRILSAGKSRIRLA